MGMLFHQSTAKGQSCLSAVCGGVSFVRTTVWRIIAQTRVRYSPILGLNPYVWPEISPNSRFATTPLASGSVCRRDRIRGGAVYLVEKFSQLDEVGIRLQ